MDLTKLFETQNALRDKIVKEKGLEEQDLLSRKIRALLTELGELSNEERSFKFWSKDREPRTVKECEMCGGSGCDTFYGVVQPDTPCHECNGSPESVRTNPLLEEYVDNLHFILDIGIDHRIMKIDSAEMEAYFKTVETPSDITIQFNSLFAIISMYADSKVHYNQIFYEIVRLGEMLGFTWDQVEKAYFEKNEINIARQESNY